MKDSDVILLLEDCIKRLIEKDCWLLVKDLNEQSITHKLAEYIQSKIPDFYNVDCEYNGDIDRIDNIKRLHILKDELWKLGLLRQKETELEEEFAKRIVYPDIIIHKRGTNKYNLCVIEVKKSTSQVPYDYDHLKLCYFTSKESGNNLNYQLGVFLKFITNTNQPSYELVFFKNGEKI